MHRSGSASPPVTRPNPVITMIMLGKTSIVLNIHRAPVTKEPSMESVLVCYQTRYGSTREIANQIAEVLERAGLRVTLIPISAVRDLTPFDAVVIGSPLYMGKWLAEAREFVGRFHVQLRARPVAVFTVGYSFRDRVQEHIPGDDEALEHVLFFISPVATGFFAGKVDPDSMSPADKSITTMAGVSPGDFRDPDAVRKWAERLPAIFRSPR